MPMNTRVATWLACLAMILAMTMAPREVRAQTVALTCSASISDIAFGSYDTLPGNGVSSNGTFSISCLNVTATTGNLYVCVALPARGMTGTATSASLAYDIYGPSPLTTSWSNTAQIVVPFAQLRLNQTYMLNVSAMVLGSQTTKPPDTYSQTLAASVTYGNTTCTSGVLAGSTTFTFNTTATILKSCNVTASNLAFGSVTSLSSVVDGQSSLTLQCSTGTGYTIALDGGLSGATSPTARKMTASGTTDAVTYGLYQNSSRSLAWGTTSTLGGTGTAAFQAIPVYGRVPVQATPTVGTYSDTIVVTVTY